MKARLVVWLFGVGLSIDCGLRWGVPGLPEHLGQLTRCERIQCIKEELVAMGAAGVDPEPIRRFLQFLSARTRPGWSHRFVTTNWDFLLQRQIDNLAPDRVPDWLFPTTQVFHLNGAVESLGDNSRRSEFVLPEESVRTPSQELSEVLGDIAWASLFVVVGMSLECGADRALFNFLNRVRDVLPSGESDWIIVNPSKVALDKSRDLIELKLPNAGVEVVDDTFTGWRAAGFPELKMRGVFRE